MRSSTCTYGAAYIEVDGITADLRRRKQILGLFLCDNHDLIPFKFRSGAKVSGFGQEHITQKRRKCHFYGLLTRLRSDRRHRSGLWAGRAAANQGNSPPIHPHRQPFTLPQPPRNGNANVPASESPGPGEKNPSPGLGVRAKITTFAHGVTPLRRSAPVREKNRPKSDSEPEFYIFPRISDT